MENSEIRTKRPQPVAGEDDLVGVAEDLDEVEGREEAQRPDPEGDRRGVGGKERDDSMRIEQHEAHDRGSDQRRQQFAPDYGAPGAFGIPGPQGVAHQDGSAPGEAADDGLVDAEHREGDVGGRQVEGPLQIDDRLVAEEDRQRDDILYRHRQEGEGDVAHDQGVGTAEGEYRIVAAQIQPQDDGRQVEYQRGVGDDGPQGRAGDTEGGEAELAEDQEIVQTDVEQVPEEGHPHDGAGAVDPA